MLYTNIALSGKFQEQLLARASKEHIDVPSFLSHAFTATRSTNDTTKTDVVQRLFRGGHFEDKHSY